ncbi:hypothetical protein MAPG_07238 [Magnaporthiopsis poae ATCC 64411]|uniref:Uncharacterized protein n=1 Tax=Magnaporthiopsis poae (strain ATCC 64411 / 73-15) TaxID=644358 RepID=A0A0C4E450_MAGP6|nr:hypothetical protein MAPG_07238 [Magnaporthiopsis poae ATCC 64411]
MDAGTNAEMYSRHRSTSAGVGAGVAFEDGCRTESWPAFPRTQNWRNWARGTALYSEFPKRYLRLSRRRRRPLCQGDGPKAGHASRCVSIRGHAPAWGVATMQETARLPETKTFASASNDLDPQVASAVHGVG